MSGSEAWVSLGADEHVSVFGRIVLGRTGTAYQGNGLVGEPAWFFYPRDHFARTTVPGWACVSGPYSTLPEAMQDAPIRCGRTAWAFPAEARSS